MNKPLLSLEQQITPSHTALLVIDMQNDFCAEGGYVNRHWHIDMADSDALAGEIMQLVKAARQQGVMVIWVRAVYDNELISDAHLARVLQQAHSDTVCSEGSWGAEFFPGIEPASDETIITKHRYSAFHGTDLDGVLTQKNISTLIITGVSTHICVDSTLRAAFFEGYHVVIPRDCVSAGDPQAQEVTLATVESSFGFVSDAQTIINHWSGYKASV